MTTPYDCALNGVLLSSLDDRICILDIREDAPEQRLITHALAGGGQMLQSVRERLTLHIDFAIHEEQPIRRKALLQSVCAWALPGGTLTISDRPDQQLTVACAGLPASSTEAWTESLTLTFAATRCPYWEDAELTTVTGTGVMTLTLPGTADTAPVEAVITNTGTAAVTRLTLHCAATSMIFENITLQPGGSFFLQMADGLLYAVIDGESILPHRTPHSDDLLLAPCGRACSVQATALQPLEAVFKARGRYA